MHYPRGAFSFLTLICVLFLVQQTATGSVAEDLAVMQPRLLPIDLPITDNASAGSMPLQIADVYILYEGKALDDDLIVDQGQVFVLKNSSLRLNSFYEGQRMIYVRDGGTLVIENSSIAPAEGSKAFLFQVEPGGHLHMRNSSLSGCGFNSPDDSSKGLWLGSDGNVLEANNLSYNYYGAIVDGRGSFIADNTIRSGYSGLLVKADGATISNNTIEDNQLYGILVSGGGMHRLDRDRIAGNGEGLVLSNASALEASDLRIEGNAGYGVLVERSRLVALKNVTAGSNGWGLYLNWTNDSGVQNAILINNTNDGVFVDNSKMILFHNSNALNNGGYGFNVTGANTMVFVDRLRNTAADNGLGDFNMPSATLSIAEVSLLSLLVVFVDKLIYLTEFQRFVLSNFFNGIVSPVRWPISEKFDRLSRRLKVALGIKPNSYRNAHHSMRLGTLFFHMVDGKDIRCVVSPQKPGRLNSDPTVLDQVRFYDLLIRDRAILVRNALYIAITVIIGIPIYSLQISLGTANLPYFLPIVIQFIVMFPISLIVQANVVGFMEKLDYDIPDEASLARLRESVLREKTGLEEQRANKRISKIRFKRRMAGLEEALTAIDHMDLRRHYLLFTPEGYAEAAARFEALLQEKPDEPLFLAGAAEAHAMLGRSMELGGGDGKDHYAKALEEAKKAYSLGPLRPGVRRTLALSLLLNGQIAEARKEIAEALRHYPGDAEAWFVKSLMAEKDNERQRLYLKAVNMKKDLSTITPEFLQVHGIIQTGS